MAITVLDSTDLAGIIAHATGEPEPSAAPKPADPPDMKPDEKAADASDAKTATAEDDADDIEGEDGTTARQKRELSTKMLKAIGKKHRQVKEAEEFAAHQYREAQEARREADELRAKIQTAPAPKAEPEATEPKRDAFATEDEFVDAKIAWGVDQGIKRAREAAQQAATQASLQAQFKRAAELVPDFEDTVKKNMNWPGGVHEYLRESDMFAELGYHFAKHPEALQKLGEMSPVKRLVALGKIEATLSPFAVPPKAAAKDGDKPDADPPKAAASTMDGITPSKTRSDAPVITPLSSSSGRSVDPDPREMSTREMIADFQKRKGINLTMRKRH